MIKTKQSAESPDRRPPEVQSNISFGVTRGAWMCGCCLRLYGYTLFYLLNHVPLLVPTTKILNVVLTKTMYFEKTIDDYVGKGFFF